MGLWNAGCDSLLASQIFFPDPVLEGDPSRVGLAFDEQWIETADGARLHAWWIPCPGSPAVLLFCHGNAGNISHRLDNLARLHQAGLSLFIFDYRGYGRSSGRPGEQGLYRDVEAAGTRAAALARQQGARLVVFGRSLGGIAAVHMAARTPVDGLILESTFTHLGDMAASLLPLPGLKGGLAGRFNALAKIPAVSAPKLFFHGDQDNIVPLELGRRLYEAASQPKGWVLLPGAGHNDTYMMGGPAYFQRIRDFVDRLPPPAPLEES